MDSVFHSLVAEFVTCSVVGTSLDASSGHPHGEGVGIMISTLPLCASEVPKFSPQTTRVSSSIPGLEVGKKGANWLVDALGCDSVIGPDIVMTVPRNVGHSSSAAVGACVELHETDPSLYKPPGHDALTANELGLLLVESIGSLSGF